MDGDHTDDLIIDSYPEGVCHAFLYDLRGLGLFVCILFACWYNSMFPRA